ncbi:hypothetical protein GALMADRAFT_778968 [Galerina marginata CBS 339.88]|uniref:Uncharacterized protein n=1 Tax=Galerina marginata (strain CBS 339.88) TaxID=685588 RepID=A0A067SNZ8_GALM3|nr:hypothetical protein GALMADRAFT_778968 [Galerina marginata CBS 339.88]
MVRLLSFLLSPLISPLQFRSLWFSLCRIDILRETEEKKLEEELEWQDEEMDDDEFEAKFDTSVDEALQRLCIEPLQALSPSGCPNYP